MLANSQRKPSGIQAKQDRSAQHFLGIQGMLLFKGSHSDQKVFQQVLQFWFCSGVDRTKRSDANRPIRTRVTVAPSRVGRFVDTLTADGSLRSDSSQKTYDRASKGLSIDIQLN